MTGGDVAMIAAMLAIVAWCVYCVYRAGRPGGKSRRAVCAAIGHARAEGVETGPCTWRVHRPDGLTEERPGYFEAMRCSRCHAPMGKRAVWHAE